MPSQARRWARRALSQNFLRSEQVAAQLAEQAEVGPSDVVLDIGAGSGAITSQLAACAGRVIAIEVDPHWVESLRRRFAGEQRVEVREGDALKVSLPRDPYKVVSNLPFHLTTELLRRLLDPNGALVRAELIVGWGLGLGRSGAASPTQASLAWQPWFEVVLVRRLPAGLFVPAPSSDAAVLSVRRRVRPLLAAHERSGYLSLIAEAYRSGGRLDRLLASRGVRHAASWLSSRVGVAADTPVGEMDVWQWIEVARVLRPPARSTGQRQPVRAMRARQR